jgi:DNA-binding NtrC family response regulator
LTINNITNAASVRKILIVDDEAEIVSIFKMILEVNDFEVDGYTNPESALFNFKPNEFGLLILDIRMPVMNGFDLFEKMKVVDSKVVACFIRHLRIIAKSSKVHLQYQMMLTALFENQKR